MKKGYWVAAGFALVFITLGVTSFQKTLTPYLSFDEARKAVEDLRNKFLG